jgi:cobalt-zinc-cadmium efflux system protein
MRAATLHVMGDLLGSVAAIIAAIVIMLTNWTPIDPLLSVLVALIILRSAWRVVADAGHILLEGAPPGLDNREIAQDLCACVAGVEDVHHIHAWSITQERPMVTMHVRVDGEATHPDRVIAEVKRRLKEKFGVEHATIEVEYGACADDHQVLIP